MPRLIFAPSVLMYPRTLNPSGSAFGLLVAASKKSAGIAVE